MRCKRPRYIGGQAPIGSRPQASKLGLRRAPAPAAPPSGAFARCPGPRYGHPSDRHRAHGARCAGASIEHDPATRPRLGRASRRVAGRPRGADQDGAKRLVAGRPRPSCKTTRTGPPSHRLVVLEDAQYGHGRAHKADHHPELTSLPASSPRLSMPGREEPKLLRKVGSFDERRPNSERRMTVRVYAPASVSTQLMPIKGERP